MKKAKKRERPIPLPLPPSELDSPHGDRRVLTERLRQGCFR